MNADPKSRDRKQLVWPGVGIVLGTVVAVSPSKTGITLEAGIAAWCAAMLLVLVLSAHPIGARAGALLAGLFLAVPCFVWASPVSRFLLMSFMCMPILAVAALVVSPPIPGFRARLAYLMTWCGKRPVTRRARALDTTSLLTLIGATAVLGVAIAAVKAVPEHGLWLGLRWLTGGAGIFAFAEMVTAGLPLTSAAFGVTVPALFNSPYRSASIGEFWAWRWNCGASALFRKHCFAPLARRGVALGLFTTFLVSAVAHALLAYMALGQWGISLLCGAFFLVQPLPIALERRMNVRRWRPAAGRAWTLAVLAVVSPLFVEPALQLAEKSWGAPDNVLLPTAASLALVIVFSGVISLASLASPRTAVAAPAV